MKKVCIALAIILMSTATSAFAGGNKKGPKQQAVQNTGTQIGLVNNQTNIIQQRIGGGGVPVKQYAWWKKKTDSTLNAHEGQIQEQREKLDRVAAQARRAEEEARKAKEIADKALLASGRSDKIVATTSSNLIPRGYYLGIDGNLYETHWHAMGPGWHAVIIVGGIVVGSLLGIEIHELTKGKPCSGQSQSGSGGSNSNGGTTQQSGTGQTFVIPTGP